MRDLGASIRRQPIGWLIGTLAALGFVWWLALALFDDLRRHRALADWIALAGMAYAVFGALVLVPYQRRRSRSLSVEGATLMRWGYGVVPELLGFAALGFGGSTWIVAVGFGASALVLVATALDARRG